MPETTEAQQGVIKWDDVPHLEGYRWALAWIDPIDNEQHYCHARDAEDRERLTKLLVKDKLTVYPRPTPPSHYTPPLVPRVQSAGPQREVYP